MNQKELTKTFMMISNWKKPFGLHNFHKKIQRFKGYLTYTAFVILFFYYTPETWKLNPYTAA